MPSDRVKRAELVFRVFLVAVQTAASCASILKYEKILHFHGMLIVFIEPNHLPTEVNVAWKNHVGFYKESARKNKLNRVLKTPTVYTKRTGNASALLVLVYLYLHGQSAQLVTSADRICRGRLRDRLKPTPSSRTAR